MPTTPQSYNFQFRGLMPGGWTASSVVGPINALAQSPLQADVLRTTPQTLADTTLGSRKYVNPNTGIRDPVVSGSVYEQPDTPAFLSQAVANLNAEQALRRSLQAEWNNRLLGGVAAGGPDAFLYAEALRAASVAPGSSVAFGQQIADPQTGSAQKTAAETMAKEQAAREKHASELEKIRRQMVQLSSNPEMSRSNPNLYADLFGRQQALLRQGPAASGWTGGRATPRPTNSFQPGYVSTWS